MEFNYTAQDVIDQNRTKMEYINSIKDWLSMCNDKLVPPVLQEQMIVQFLLSCDNDVEFTKTTISAFYRCKKAAPELHDDRDMRRPDIRTALNTMHMATLPVRTDDNCAIHFFKLNDTNYHNYDVSVIMKLSFMLVDVTLKNNPPDGLMVFLDMKGIKIHPSDMPNERLYELVPKKCLPKEYGGDLPSEKELHEITLGQLNDRQAFWEIEEMIRKELGK
ncbi:unnamed protein product [Callosobruchus maculatus]|uniref:CRAL-TRIO domain-containing protein n=1 Tax=Callosobruchus maculatus TaxID=64391 RepID=A0A653DPF7_CALMS|nr:unnamed protein product [Callosobruchus maculatus]